MKTTQPKSDAPTRPSYLIKKLIRGLIGSGLLVGLVTSLHAQGTLTLSNIWNIPVNAVYDMGAANNERGVAINPVTGNVFSPAERVPIT